MTEPTTEAVDVHNIEAGDEIILDSGETVEVANVYAPITFQHVRGVDDTEYSTKDIWGTRMPDEFSVKKVV